jgi:hypothetical protein
MSNKSSPIFATMGIDIGKNSFHVVGVDRRGAIELRQKWSCGQVEARLANMPPCLIGMEACVGAHHLSRKVQAQGHDARLMPAKYGRPYSKGQKNDFRDAEAIAEAVQRPTMKFIATVRGLFGGGCLTKRAHRPPTGVQVPPSLVERLNRPEPQWGEARRGSQVPEPVISHRHGPCGLHRSGRNRRSM